MEPISEFTMLTAGLASWSAYVLIASFLVEGVCDVLFSWSFYENKLSGKGLKVPIAFGLSFLACWQGHIDPFAMASTGVNVSLLGILLSAGFVAGGSKKAATRLGTLRKTIQDQKPA